MKPITEFLPVLPIALVIVGVVLDGCYIHEGNEGFSGSIQKSKELGVFVAGYVPERRSDTLIDGVSVTWEDVWLERQWYRSGWIFRPVGSIRGDIFYVYIKIPREQYNSLTQKLGTFGEDWRIRANDGHFMRITAGADPFVCFYGLHDDSASATLDLSLLVRRSTNDTSGSREPSEIKASLKFERVQ